MLWPFRHLLSLLVLLLLLCPGFTYGQSLVTRQVLDLPELEGAEYYQVYQDQKGFVWLASDRGLVRYDGQQARVFTTKDGMAENVTFYIDEDSQGRVYFIGYTGDVSYYENGKMHIRQEHDGPTWRDKTQLYLSEMKVDTQDRVWLSNDTAIFRFRLGEPGQFLPIPDLGKDLKISPVGKNDYFNYINHFDELIKEVPAGLQVGEGLRIPLSFEKHRGGRILYEARPGKANELLLVCNHQLFRIDTVAKTSTSQSFPFKIKQVLHDRDNHLWIGSFDSGLYCYPNGDWNATPVHLLAGETISDLLQDRHGGVWITTIKQGVHFIPAAGAFCIDSSEGVFVTCVNGDKDGIFWGTKYGKVFRSDTQTLSTAEIFTNDFFDKVTLLQVQPSGKMMAHGHPRISTHDFPHFPELIVNPGLLQVPLKTDTLTLGRASLNLINELSKGHVNPKWINCIKGDAQQLLIGTNSGLVIRQNDSIYTLSNQFPMLGDRIRNICAWPEGGWLIATQNHGLLYWNEQLLEKVHQANGKDAFFRHIFVDEQQRIWLAGTNGVTCLKVVQFGERPTEVWHYDRFDGLPSYNVNQVYVMDSYIYAATSLGLYRLPIRPNNAPTQEPHIYLRATQLAGSDTVLEAGVRLPPSKRDLTFVFQAVWQQDHSNLHYQYRLRGLEEQWRNAPEKTIRFTTLPPGEYTLEVRVKARQNTWEDPKVLAQFVLLPKFSETPWFGLLIVVVILLISGGGFAWLLQSEKTKVRLEQEAQQFQHEALVAQLKPHFIYNSLNSIQNFILNNQIDASTDYLSRFAALLRKVLHHSHQKLVTVEEERMALQLYLELESMRFEHRFQFHFKFGKGVQVNALMIPPMLLQPLIENALWHGVLPQRGGTITVSWAIADDQLICHVEDDGVGRGRAKTLTSGNQRSYGTHLCNKRLQLMGTSYKKATSLTITDKVDADGKPAGTRVEVTLPLVHKNKNA